MLLVLLLMATSAAAETRLLSYPGVGPKLYEVSEINEVYQEVTRDSTYRVVSFPDTLDGRMRWVMLVDRDRDPEVDVMVLSLEVYMQPAHEHRLRELAFRLTTRGLPRGPGAAEALRRRYPDLRLGDMPVTMVLCDEGGAVSGTGTVTEYPQAKARADARQALARARARRQAGSAEAGEHGR